MSESKIPTRDELSGKRNRIIRVRLKTGDPEKDIPLEAALKDITWFTEWKEVPEDGVTVHTVTPNTLKNAVAAGYTQDQLPNKIQDKVHLPECVEYALEGDQTILSNAGIFVRFLLADIYMCTEPKSGFDDIYDAVSLVNGKTVVKQAKPKRMSLRENLIDVWPFKKNDNRVPKKMKAVDDKQLKSTDGLSLIRCSPEIPDIRDVFGYGECSSPPTVAWYIDTYGTPSQWSNGLNYFNLSVTEVTAGAESKNEIMQKTPETIMKLRKFAQERTPLAFKRKPQEIVERANGLENSFWKHLPDAEFKAQHDNPFHPIGETKESQPYAYGWLSYLLRGEQEGDDELVGFRQAQKDALENMFFAANGKTYLRSGTYVLPCGAGKTIVGIAAAVRSRGSTLILVPNKNLKIQWKRELKRRALITTTNVVSESCVMVETWDKLKFESSASSIRTDLGEERRMFKIINHSWGLIVIDEAHLMASTSNTTSKQEKTTQKEKLKQKLRSKSIVCLTATAQLSPEYISTFPPVVYETAWPLKNTKAYDVEYGDDTLEEVVTSILAEDIRRKVVIFCHLVDDTQNIWKTLSNNDKNIWLSSSQKLTMDHVNKMGIRYKFLNGKAQTDVRDHVYEQFKAVPGFRVLIMNQIGEVGIDLPNVTDVIVYDTHAGGEKAGATIAQEFGRGLRGVEEGATERRLYHFYGTGEEKHQDRTKFLRARGYKFEDWPPQGV